MFRTFRIRTVVIALLTTTVMIFVVMLIVILILYSSCVSVVGIHGTILIMVTVIAVIDYYLVCWFLFCSKVT